MENLTTRDKTFKTIMLTLGGVLLVLAVFQAGVFVGYRKAIYSFHWGDARHRQSTDPRASLMGPPPDLTGADMMRGYMGGHGIEGTVTRIDGNNLIIKDANDAERQVDITSGTTVRPQGDVPLNAHVVIIGAPDDEGRIDAKLIQVAPSTK